MNFLDCGIDLYSIFSSMFAPMPGFRGRHLPKKRKENVKMELKPLTAQQKKVLDYIAKYQDENGFPPTFKEIGEAVGIGNINAVRGHLLALEKKGYIVKDPVKARTIRILHAPSKISRLKRKMHEILRTNQGVVHQVVYGLAWTTWKAKPFLKGKTREAIKKAIDREVVERGWTLIDRKMKNNHIVLVVKTWPNHSPEQTVKRFKSACRAAKNKNPEIFPDHQLWGRGYAVATSLELLDELVSGLLERQSDKKK